MGEDVAEADFAARFFDAAEEAFGPVTMLVNNAGVTGRIGPFKDATIETLRRTVDANLMGPMFLAQEAVRRWEAAGIPGRMVNISSIASTLGAPNEYVHYAATKAAIEAMTIGLGKEVAAKGIRVNAVAPGTAFTDIHAAAGEPDRPARVVARVPMGRIADPAEIAAAVLWLLSDEASYVTGTVLRVSGGLQVERVSGNNRPRRGIRSSESLRIRGGEARRVTFPPTTRDPRTAGRRRP